MNAGVPKSLHALWTTQAVPEGQSPESLSSCVQLCTKLFSVFGLENLRKEHPLKMQHRNCTQLDFTEYRETHTLSLPFCAIPASNNHHTAAGYH